MADKAILFGVDNYKKVNPLRGCVNDVDSMRRLLVEVFQFDDKNIRTFTNQQVVKSEAKKQMKWLFTGAKEGDRLLLHFSGHGSFVPDPEDNGEGKKAELICLYDMDFNDADTYFLNHELRDWAKGLPKGAELTFVLDSCHSGKGTRLVMAPVPGRPHEQVAVHVDVEASTQRALAAGGVGMRDLAAVAEAATDPHNVDTVVARYVDPPPEIKMAVSDRPTRALVVAELNHTLLAACRDDQTAADANIGGKPCGAFTYYLCKTLREGGANLDRKILSDRLETALSRDHFDQVPQIEGRSSRGPIYTSALGKDSPAPAEAAPTTPVGGAGGTGGAADPVELVREISRLERSAQRPMVELLKLRLGRAGTPGGRRDVGGRHLVYVHGICKHPPGYSDDWYAALHQFTNTFGAGKLDDTRHEVQWSDIVHGRGLQAAGARGEDEAAEWSARIRGVIEQRATEQIEQAQPAAARALYAEQPVTRDAAAARGLSLPDIACIEDFSTYMFNNSTRQQIIDRFTGVVRPLLEGGAEVDVISHSWGTVVAYEGLRELQDAGLTSGVHNLFTVGAALSIFLVRLRLRSANRDGRKPAQVQRWVNLNAQGDPVGGRLRGIFDVDEEFLGLDNFGCGTLDTSCAHSSYFKKENAPVNQDIFAKFIDEE